MCLFQLKWYKESSANLPGRPLQSQPGLSLGKGQDPVSRPERDGHWVASHNPPGGGNQDENKCHEGKQIFNVFSGHLTFETGEDHRAAYKHGPLQHVGHNHGNEALRETKTHEGVSRLNTQEESAHILLSVVLPFAGVCQGQSSEEQSEEGLLLPSGSRTCGPRHELDVFEGGGGRYAVVTIHKLCKITLCPPSFTLRNRKSLLAFGGVSDAQNVQEMEPECVHDSFKNPQLKGQKPTTEGAQD